MVDEGTGEEAPKREFVNVPDRFVRLGWDVWGQSLRDFLNARELCWSLIRKEIISRYRQSVVGFGWAVITPLATIAVFTFLNMHAYFDVGETEVPYPVFVYVALLPWQLFHACLARTTSSLAASGSLVSRTRFPHEALVVSAMGSAFFDFLVGLALLGVLCLIYRTAIAWTVVFLPLLLAVQLLFSLSLGLVLGALNAAARDLKSAVSMGALLWMFLTPVLYPAPPAESIVWWLNPMAPIIAGYRDLALGGTIAAGPLVLSVAISLILLPFSWRFFHIMLPRIAQTV